jgi:23S rRNA pseudouridine2605 synthase
MSKEKIREQETKTPQRINRILSWAGHSSRRKGDELIVSGRVMLNGRIIRELGTKAVWGRDSIKVDGREIRPPSERSYLMLNKPFGYICTLNDPSGRPLASDLLKTVKQRVYSVGRLDFDSLGLLLFTDDGEWAHRLSHPRYHVPKTYKITVEGRLTKGELNALTKGVQLDDGFSGPSKTTLIQEKQGKSLLRMTVTRGRSRLIRRMMEAVGFRVVHLIRTGFGILELGDLKIGHYRHLESEEVEAMKKMVGL